LQAFFLNLCPMLRCLAFLIFVSTFCACGPRKSTKHAKNAVHSEINYAKCIDIHETKTGTIVTIIDPEANIHYPYFLGKTKEGCPKNAHYIQVPIKGIIALSGTHVGMLSVLNEIDLIRGIPNAAYIYNRTLRKRIAKGKARSLGTENGIPVESIIATKADVLMYSGGFGSGYPKEVQLQKLGTLCIPNFDWKEAHPLGKAEWLLFFGYLTGKEQQAKDYFAKIEKRYLDLRKQANKTKRQPNVFSGNLIGDIWFAPTGQSFGGILLRDAGADYSGKNTKGTGSIERSIQDVMTNEWNTEFWIDPGATSLKDLLKRDQRYQYLSAVKNKKVYCYSHNMNRFWEMSIVEPDKVLFDFIRIFHPELGLKGHLHYYKQLQ
jgi:iron complex transport system substrate-binding protein